MSGIKITNCIDGLVRDNIANNILIKGSDNIESINNAELGKKMFSIREDIIAEERDPERWSSWVK